MKSLTATNFANHTGEWAQTAPFEGVSPLWAPMNIEKWAIVIITAAGFKISSQTLRLSQAVTATKRFYSHCPCCESLAEPFEDIHLCNVCDHTYHWSCPPRLGCYKDVDRESVKKAETLACPACACLTDSEIRVTGSFR